MHRTITQLSCTPKRKHKRKRKLKCYLTARKVCLASMKPAAHALLYQKSSIFEATRNIPTARHCKLTKHTMPARTHTITSNRSLAYPYMQRMCLLPRSPSCLRRGTEMQTDPFAHASAYNCARCAIAALRTSR